MQLLGIDPVLKYIENMKPMCQLKMRETEEKTAILLASSTAHRLQTLAIINIDNIKISSFGLEIRIPDLIKTLKSGVMQPILMLPYFKEKPQLCVASMLLDYLKMTKDLREGHKKLFITTVRPYGPASVQTIAHWIKSLLGKAGVNIREFGAYSTRHVAVSAAFKKGVDIDTIRKIAGW